MGRERCTRIQGGGARTGDQIQQQLGRLDALTRQQQAQRKMEPLFERLTNLERNVANAAAARNAAWRYPAMPPMPMMPGMRPPMGLSAAAMMASMGAAAQQMPGKGGMRPPFGGKGGAAVMPEAEIAAMGAGIDAEDDESASTG